MAHGMDFIDTKLVGYGLGGFSFRYLAYINLCVEGCVVEENQRGCGSMRRTVAAFGLGIRRRQRPDDDGLSFPVMTFIGLYGTMASISARYNYYLPCPWPEKVLGVKAHADSSSITVLLQDEEVEGLQLLSDNQWVGVPIVRDALTINVGD
ncbi:non-heme dioxygenase N-terminal domain-containing protein [Tanacetum coccineum]|uniref:Non-heme dioxygenase N-terminal domain-containing protein n=1 Tax=Tanacetum coccineum TaxID=301880 RepID=A0ABQ5AQ22_9ASTR